MEHLSNFEIMEIADQIRDNRKWETKCGGCRHLRKGRWFFAGRELPAYSCGHPERQGQWNDPHAYGCGGNKYEK